MKEANEVAARLVRIALHSHGAAEWFWDPPIVLHDALVADSF